MQSSSSNDEQTSRGDKRGLAMVALGLLLFVMGFMVTLTAIGDNQSPTTGDISSNRGDAGLSDPSNAFLVTGILVSLVGVVLATIGPAVGMVRGKS